MLGLPKILGLPALFSRSSCAERQLLRIATGHDVRQGLKKCRGGNRRYKTTEAGDEKSGHINAGPNEGILFLDSKYLLSRYLLGVH